MTIGYVEIDDFENPFVVIEFQNVNLKAFSTQVFQIAI